MKVKCNVWHFINKWLNIHFSTRQCIIHVQCLFYQWLSTNSSYTWTEIGNLQYVLILIGHIWCHKSQYANQILGKGSFCFCKVFTTEGQLFFISHKCPVCVLQIYCVVVQETMTARSRSRKLQNGHRRIVKSSRR